MTTVEAGKLYLRDSDLARRYGVSRPTIWTWALRGDGFPLPVKLGPNCTRWRADEIEAWERRRQQERRNAKV